MRALVARISVRSTISMDGFILILAVRPGLTAAPRARTIDSFKR